MHKSIEYGAVQFTVKKHDNMVTSIDANKTSMIKTKDNVQALTMIGSLIKAIQQQIIAETKDMDPNYTPPNLTFTLFFSKDGQTDRVHVNDFKRKTFKR
jgi:hypothetical protein